MFDLSIFSSWTQVTLATLTICAILLGGIRTIYNCLHRIETKTDSLNDKFNQEALHQHFRHEANLVRFDTIEKKVEKVDSEVEDMGKVVVSNTTRLGDHIKYHK